MPGRWRWAVRRLPPPVRNRWSSRRMAPYGGSGVCSRKAYAILYKSCNGTHSVWTYGSFPTIASPDNMSSPQPRRGEGVGGEVSGFLQMPYLFGKQHHPVCFGNQTTDAIMSFSK